MKKSLHNHSIKILKALNMGLLVLSLSFCSEPDSKEKTRSEAKSQEFRDNFEFIDISLNLNASASLALEGSSSLSLSTAVSHIFVSLSGCSSNYSFTELLITTGSFAVVNSDQNCILQLDEFHLDGERFSPKVGSEFTTWLPPDSGIYVGESSAKELSVSVSSQINQAGASVSDMVSFEFRDIKGEASNSLKFISFGKAIALGAGIAPDFEMVHSELVIINPDRSAYLDFSLECGSTLTGSQASDYRCSDLLMNTELDYLLVKDTYGGALTEGDADAIFASGSPISITNFIAPGNNDPYNHPLPNGGFSTGSLLTGTEAIFPSALDYLLILRRTDGVNTTLSYVYFLVRIPDVESLVP